MKSLTVIAGILVCINVYGDICDEKLGDPSRCGNERVEISHSTRNLTDNFRLEIDRGELGRRTDRALDALINFAAYRLKRAGHNNEANTLIREWNENWRGSLILYHGIGDHRPLSEWLAQKYTILELILGEQICQWTRLEDIKVFNFAVPVVFSCLDSVDLKEYEAHFEPFLGVVAYWSTFVGCTGGTWGTGFLFCSPIALGVEYLTETFVSPRTVDTAWSWACQ